MTDAECDEPPLFADLSGRLRDAHKMLATLDVDDDARAVFGRRLIAVTEASKRDLRRASERLDQLLNDLNSGAGSPGLWPESAVAQPDR